MVDINPKFIAAIVIAAILIASGIYYFHGDYQAKPYEKLELKFFVGEVPILAFNQMGSSASPVGNATIHVSGTVTTSNGPLKHSTVYIYDFPWVVAANTTGNGSYSFTFLMYGTFTIGYKSMGYTTTYKTFTMLNGNSLKENVFLKKAEIYNVSGNTLNQTGVNIPDVNVVFHSFFGSYQTISGNVGNYINPAQNGTYLIITYKNGYNSTPKPRFVNVTGSIINNFNLVMNRTNSTTYYISGLVLNRLGTPISGAKVQDTVLTSKGPIQALSVYTNSKGFYIIPVPGGYNNLTFTDVAFLTNSTGQILVTSNMTENMVMISRDPFTTTGIGPTGLTFLPSFMQEYGLNYLDGNLSSIGFSSGQTSLNFNIKILNSFYSNSPQSSSFFSGMVGAIAGNFNGTIYYESISVKNVNGLITATSHYAGSYDIVLYLNGFNISEASQNIPTTKTYSVTMTPLPGQYFRTTLNATNSVTGQKLFFTNDTLLENLLPVNFSAYSSTSSFYYFIDTSQIYSITLTYSVNEIGFINGTKSIVVKSTNPTYGSKTGVINITLSMTPSTSISSGFLNTTRTVPGISQSAISSKLTDVQTSNIKNTGNSTYEINLTSESTGEGGFQFIIYTEINGYVYSKVVNFSNTINANLNFSGFYNGNFNAVIVGQMWKSNDFTYLFTYGQKNYFQNTIPLVARNVSIANISVKSKLSKDLELYKLGGNLSVPVAGIAIGAYSIAMNWTAVKSNVTGTHYTYYLPMSSPYSIEYIHPLYILNITSISLAKQKYINVSMYVNSYGSIAIVNTSVNTTIEPHQSNGVFHPFNFVTGIGNTYYIVGCNSQPIFYTITIDKLNFTTKPLLLTQTNPLNIENISLVSGVKLANLTPSGSIIYNNSVDKPSNEFVITNTSFWSEVSSSGTLVKSKQYNLTTGGYLNIINQNFYPPTYPASYINNINFLYNSTTTSLSFKIYLGNNGVPEDVMVYYGYNYAVGNGYVKTE
ncbi:MAG: hypothetical protein M1460_03945 [Candidatus Thermoplasmatota archaeon]|nr:hypothetical protein [Candidatus Thermoplasmatota archaeon]